MTFMAGIYLHIPFCKRRCIYCDFFSTTREGDIPRYVDALRMELAFRHNYLKKPGSEEQTARPVIHTVYIGGGTPSLLPPAELGRLLETIHTYYYIAPTAEITVEANPDDVTDKWAAAVHDLGCNRISLGVQTFDDERLRFLCRRHTGRQAVEAVERCRKAGFDNLSIDLIYGLPGQSVEDWERDVETTIKVGTEHLSAYALIYEEGTALWRLRADGRIRETDEEVSLRMFERLIERLDEARFEHYEISNFARPGRFSRHNSSYWQGIPYLGCGAAAHSFDGKSRQWNTADLDTYIRGVDNLCRTGEAVDLWERETLTLEERYNERIITSIRTKAGLDLQRLQDDFGKEHVDYCLRMAAPHLQRGTLRLLSPTPQAPAGTLCLSRQGVFVSDGIMSDLLRVEE